MRVIDSHTGGEPTRVILDGAPELGSESLRERADRLASEHRDFCQSILREPRGKPAMVGALLVEPTDPRCTTGVIYFDLAAVLGMCGHGTIGLVVTLAHMGRISTGSHLIETPVGKIEVTLHDANTVTLKNIESRRTDQDVTLDVPGFGFVTGDIAYGGNWFYIVDPSPIPVTPENIEALSAFAKSIREAAHSTGRGGDNGEPIDHVILQSDGAENGGDGRNFVLCPDDAFDRSPCGTGCSALLACLAASHRLAPGEEIVQTSIVGSRYRLSYQQGSNGGVIPSITGQAFVTGEGRLFFQNDDPFRNGIAF